jgi:hypothetical protein
MRTGSGCRPLNSVVRQHSVTSQAMVMAALAGVFAGVLIVSGAVSWIHKTNSIHKEHGGWKEAVLFSLFNSAPWTLVAAVVAAYFTYSEPWAPGLFAGFGAGSLIVGGLLLYVWNVKRKANAA